MARVGMACSREGGEDGRRGKRKKVYVTSDKNTSTGQKASDRKKDLGRADP